MKRWTGLMAVAAAAVVATGAAAQETSAGERGSRSISVDVGEQSSVGLWFRMSDRADLGLQLGATRVNLSDDDDTVEQTGTQFEVGPAVKLYTAPQGAFQPYTFLGAFFRYAESETSFEGFGDATSIEREFGGRVGVGLDWFPASRISVGAHVGVEGALLNGDIGDEDTGETVGVEGSAFRTFTSGIRVHLYL